MPGSSAQEGDSISRATLSGDGPAATLDSATSALREWLTPFLEGTGVCIMIASRGSDEPRGAWLVLETARLAVRGQAGASLTALMDYRLLLCLGDSLAEQRCLGEILFATTDHALYASEHGLRQEASGTSLALSSQLVRHPPQRLAPPVRIAPRPRITGLGVLEGVVLGPGDVPLVDVPVSFGESGPSRRTDAQGRFTFPALPLDAVPWRIGIQAKGRRFTVEAKTNSFCVARIPLGG